MYPSLEELKAILLKGNYVSEADNEKAESSSHDVQSYIEFLYREQLLTKQLLGQAIAEAYNIPYVNLNTSSLTKDSIAIIPSATAHSNRSIFVKSSPTIAAIATDNPEGVRLKELSEFFPGKKLRLAYTLPEQIDLALTLYEQPLQTRFSGIIKSGQRVAPEIVDEIIKDALTFHASDIHFEPYESDVLVRFRIDGSLREAGRVPKNYYDNILNRVKVESGMRIDEHLSAQDGALQRNIDGHMIDLRIAIVPTVLGEKIAMRVLGSYIQSYTLADLGLGSKHLQMIETYAVKPFGMILSVGPTGSGKTTTLYALLKLLNRPNVNITSIEDPVEYRVNGVNQIQVREQTGITFARGLRSIVRQDPDVILVGEIRDEETADIAVNAALTGHLLLSTFHSNDASTAIPRLIDMGIEPFLLASTLELVIAQRLVRRICTHCRFSLPISEALKLLPTGADLAAKYFAKNDTVYAGKGCHVCNGTGYFGRTALFEFLEITPGIQDLIIKSPAARDIENLARKQGFKPMFEDGTQKVKSGLTTIAEVARVVAPSHKE